MATCFICNDKLLKERKRMSTSFTPHSKVPYLEKLVSLMGEEFVIIVTSSDHICMRCSSLLNHMDKLENDLDLIKSELLLSIHKKYELLPTVPPVDSIMVDNDHLIPDEELQVDQSNASNKSNTALINNSMNVDNDRLIPDGKLQFGQNKVSSKHEENKKKRIYITSQKTQPKNSKTTMYMCVFCKFYSKEIGLVRTHMLDHKNKVTNENQTVTQPPRRQLANKQLPKKPLFKCEVCDLCFETKLACISHINNHHHEIHTILIDNEIEKKEEIASTIIKPAEETLMITEENHNMFLNIEDGGQEGNPMNSDLLLLNDYLSTNEITNMEPSFMITGNVNTVQFLENDENVSGFDPVNIDLESLLAAMHGD